MIVCQETGMDDHSLCFFRLVDPNASGFYDQHREVAIVMWHPGHTPSVVLTDHAGHGHPQLSIDEMEYILAKYREVRKLRENLKHRVA